MRSTIGVTVAFVITLFLIWTNEVTSWTAAAILVWLAATAAAVILVFRSPKGRSARHRLFRSPSGRSKRLGAGRSTTTRAIEVKPKRLPNHHKP